MKTISTSAMTQIEQIPTQLLRRNWIILFFLLAGSLPFGNLAFSGGILTGGLIAIGGFYWLQRSVGRLLHQPNGGARFRYQFGYVIRLVTLAAILAFLIAVINIHTLGLITGLSVVVINIFWFTLERAFKL